MKTMIVDAKAFSDGMNKVSRVLKKSPVPILEEVHVSVRNAICTLTATDMETWLTAQLPVQGDDMAFVFYKTKDVLKACSHFDGVLTIRLCEQTEKEKVTRKLMLCCGQRAAEYPASSAEDYPMAVSVEDGAVFCVNAAQLLKRIERVRYAALKSGQNTKPFSTCVQFEEQRVFSVDGYRMACDAQADVTFPVPFLVSGSDLSHLKVFGTNDITVRVGTHHVQFTNGAMSLFVRRQGVEPFNVDAAIPERYQEIVAVKTADFIRELNYLKECAAGCSRPYVRFVGEQLILLAPNGRFRTSVVLHGRGDLVLGFDLRYMLDALKQFKDEPEVTLKLSGVLSPIVIEAENRSDFALVLPVRLKEQKAA